MNNGILIGVAAFDEDGFGFDQAGAVLVCGVSKKEWLIECLRECEEFEVKVREVYSDEILETINGGSAAIAFDGEAFRAFELLATAQGVSPVGSFRFGFSDADYAPYIIFGNKNLVIADEDEVASRWTKDGVLAEILQVHAKHFAELGIKNTPLVSWNIEVNGPSSAFIFWAHDANPESVERSSWAELSLAVMDRIEDECGV